MGYAAKLATAGRKTLKDLIDGDLDWIIRIKNNNSGNAPQPLRNYERFYIPKEQFGYNTIYIVRITVGMSGSGTSSRGANIQYSCDEGDWSKNLWPSDNPHILPDWISSFALRISSPHANDGYTATTYFTYIE